MRRGLHEAKENIGVSEEGDCQRCGGESQQSSMTGYLQCSRCGYEWSDPNHVSRVSRPERTSIDQDMGKVDEFKKELSEGTWSNVMGVDSKLSGEQEAGLKRLESKWMDGMKGHFNAAEEERKPLMISFDDSGEDLVDTTVGTVTLLTNDFDGGEEIRVEYPGIGTEFYILDEESNTGWRRGRTSQDTARSIAYTINKHSKFVHASSIDTQILFELRDHRLDVDSLVLFVSDPGGQDMIAEKGGVNLDPRMVHQLSDYKIAVELVLADGVITPSEDQLLWAMRDQLGITDEDHVRIVVSLFGEDVVKECVQCGADAKLYTEHLAWYCDACESWN